MTDTILRLPDVKTSTGLSRSSIYLRIAQGEFPKPVSLGGRAVGWPASEVAALNAARIAGKSNAEIRDLVVKLEAAPQDNGMSGDGQPSCPSVAPIPGLSKSIGAIRWKKLPAYSARIKIPCVSG